jgi:penicillin G amidase
VAQATVASGRRRPRRRGLRWRGLLWRGLRWRRILLWAGIVVLAIVLVLALALVWAVRAGFAEYDGELSVSGLSAPVTVYRDARAIPQLYARTDDDLFTAQGYVHAQERFWEMDFRRHVTSGRTAELFGASAVGTDRFLRTMGWRRVAEREWPLISPASRRYLTDYANGVNAWLAGHAGAQAGLEYAILGLTNSGYTIAKWDPVDSLAWLKAMAWDLRGNLDSELTRATMLADGLSRDRIEQLYPDYPYAQHRPIVDAGSVHDGVFQAVEPALEKLGAAVRALPGLVGKNTPGIGSNSWVVAGSHTTTGKPFLANDPHLGPTMPGIWFQMGLHCSCDFNVTGFTFSGVPGVVIGHNASIAWGFTNLDPDVTDLYVEKVDGDRYQVDGQWRPFEIRHETITVAGGQPVPLTVRLTNNGPLMSDVWDDLDKVSGGKGYGVALRWTALDPGRTMDSLFSLDRAGNWLQFKAAAAQFEVPAQNMTYADVRGNIGYQAPGRIPVRGNGDGRWPAPGWDSTYDWTGYVPAAALPSASNPARGYLVTANQAVVDQRTYPYFLTDDWSYGYRSSRISSLLDKATAGGARVSTLDMEKLQFDSYNGLAAQLVPGLLREPVPVPGLSLLRGWDFQQGADSAPAMFFNAFYRHLLARTFDELPDSLRPDGDDRWWVVVLNLWNQPDSPWWDVKGTPRVEHRDDVVTAALRDASAELVSAQGNDPQKWRWGAVHTLELENQSLGKSGIAPVEWLFNRGPAAVSGSSSAVDATGWDPSFGYAVSAAPSMRMVLDLSNWDRSRWIELTGESGHPFSAHYDDQFDVWRAGLTLPMRWDEDTVRREARDTLVLKPIR